MKTTTLVDISSKSNRNEQTSSPRSGWVAPFLLLRLSGIIAIRPTRGISRALGLLEMSVSSVQPEGVPGPTLHLPALVVMRTYNLNEGHGCRPNATPRARTFFLMWKLSGSSFISARTYVNEDTTFDKHEFKVLQLNYLMKKETTYKNGIVWVNPPCHTLFHPIRSLLLSKLSRSLESAGSDPLSLKQ